MVDTARYTGCMQSVLAIARAATRCKSLGGRGQRFDNSQRRVATCPDAFCPHLLAAAHSWRCSRCAGWPARGPRDSTPSRARSCTRTQPLAGALVTFHPKGNADVKTERPTALTKEDGTFTVTTGQKDGAPAGEYLVTIICTAPVNKKAGKLMSLGADEETTDVLHGAYADVNNSKLPVTIKSGPNQLEPFDLK